MTFSHVSWLRKWWLENFLGVDSLHPLCFTKIMFILSLSSSWGWNRLVFGGPALGLRQNVGTSEVCFLSVHLLPISLFSWGRLRMRRQQHHRWPSPALSRCELFYSIPADSSRSHLRKIYSNFMFLTLSVVFDFYRHPRGRRFKKSKLNFECGIAW